MSFGGFNTRINGEDNYGATQRGEDTSRLEAKLESQMEGLHAEDHPDLLKTIKTAQEAEEKAQEEVDEANQKWLAAQADGTVKAMQGAVDVKKIVPQEEDNEIDALRKLRLAQMRGRAEARKHWLAKGHGTYVRLEQESSFLQKLPEHERAVCAICAAGSMDGEMLQLSPSRRSERHRADVAQTWSILRQCRHSAECTNCAARQACFPAKPSKTETT